MFIIVIAIVWFLFIGIIFIIYPEKILNLYSGQKFWEDKQIIRSIRISGFGLYIGVAILILRLIEIL